MVLIAPCEVLKDDTMNKANPTKKSTTRIETAVLPVPWLEVTNASGKGLSIDSFSARAGELWCIWGKNRSGLDELVQLFSGGESDQFLLESSSLPEDLAVISFSNQQKIFEEEVRNDDSDYLQKIDPGTLARDFLGTEGNHEELIQLFNLGHVLDSGYRQLSSGESRKLVLLNAITNGNCHLVVQNPYDGLDTASCSEFDQIMTSLHSRGFGIIITLTSRRDIPSWCTHLACMHNGKLVEQGLRRDVLAALPEKASEAQWVDTVDLETAENGSQSAEILVSLKNGQARYGKRVIFSGLDFVVEKGGHTLITGPNGAGKSTLLAIISGDHSDCYANDLHLFGIRRGSGESIWDLKKNMGIVSPDLHRNHYIPGNTLQIVISGFFDSIGLYRNYTQAQERQARQWLKRLGLEDLEKKPFRQLTFGEQRLILIARALIKMPKLLLLDEPTQGLDDVHRDNLLQFLERVAEAKLSTILYVSHRQDEYRDFFRQHLEIG